MNISIVIPSDLVPPSVSDAKRWAIDVAVNAARSGVSPIVPDKTGKNHNIKAYLGQAVIAALSGRPDDVSMSDHISGLVNAWVIQERMRAAESGRKLVESKAPSGLRPEQMRLVEHAETAAAFGGIVFAEAGTGVGKTMAALAMAARYADRTGRAAVFAVPTITVLGQAVDEYQNRLDAAAMGLGRKPAMGFLVGRGSFADPALLRDILENPGDIPMAEIEQARVWVESGARWAPGAKTALLHRAIPDLAWLIEDLQHAAPGFPAEQVRMGEESAEDCPAQAFYKRFRETALTAEVVICTHAMLGLDVMISSRTPGELNNRIADIDHRLAVVNEKLAAAHGVAKDRLESAIKTIESERRRADARLAESHKEQESGRELVPILPKYGFLLIDEAHQFESAVASLRSSDVNPRLLAAELTANMAVFNACRCKTAARHIVGVLEKMHAKMAAIGAKIKDERVRVNGADGVVNMGVADALAPFIRELDGKDGVSSVTRKCQSSRPLLYPLAAVVRNMRENGDGVWVNFSPRRKYPSIYTGPRTVKPLMERIWDRVDAAVLLSATLGLPDNNSLPRIGFLASQMFVPSQRMKVITPIVQPWLYSATLIETGKGRKDLAPPTDAGDDDAEKPGAQTMASWAKAVATEIRLAAESAKGGTLALTSGYERIKAVAAALPEMGERLVIQNRRTGVRAAQALFEQKARAGLRPVWLAAGPAWTGLDLSDREKPAGEDFMLTDLVVINIPFGTNQSTTHRARLEWMKLAERDRAALEFKQGIGRLVRREGLPDRRIHILDPRVWRPLPYFAPFRRMLERYPAASSY